eukprot:3494748-Pleurochrysis_carterae.AAC.1
MQQGADSNSRRSRLPLLTHAPSRASQVAVYTPESRKGRRPAVVKPQRPATISTNAREHTH